MRSAAIQKMRVKKWGGRNLKAMLARKIGRMAVLFILLMLSCITVFQIYICQKNMKEESRTILMQMEGLKEEGAATDWDGLFSRLLVREGTALYAVLPETGRILGSTRPGEAGEAFYRKISSPSFSKEESFFHGKIDGELWCFSGKKSGALLLFRAFRARELYRDAWKTVALIALCLSTLTGFLVFSIIRYLDEKIVKSIWEINKKLLLITEGKFDETVDVRGTPEFRELSFYINMMLKSILGFTDKMSYILDRAQIKVGVYEYNGWMPGVRATDQVREILGIDGDERLLADSRSFERYIQRLKKNPVPDYENTYQVNGVSEQYIRLEAFQKGNNWMGVVVDVTGAVLKGRKLETESSRDILTGLYNRRGLEARLMRLFETPDKLKHSAIIMLDADGLKTVNDWFGHKTGDLYLKKTAEAIKSVKPPQRILSRQGGDEFILFYYGCESRSQLLGYIEELKGKRDVDGFLTETGEKVVIRFSMGYVFSRGTDYEALLREADRRMYEEKSGRKKRN